MGNGINWRGQIFPAMRNMDKDGKKMSAVTDALKRHYKNWLLDYEECHPEDVAGDRSDAGRSVSKG